MGCVLELGPLQASIHHLEALLSRPIAEAWKFESDYVCVRQFLKKEKKREKVNTLFQITITFEPYIHF
jgi:hypothetical protein